MESKTSSPQVQLLLQHYSDCLQKWNHYESGKLKTQLESIASTVQQIEMEQQGLYEDARKYGERLGKLRGRARELMQGRAE